jgi:hypothetical protein
MTESESLDCHDEIIMKILNEKFPNDIQHLEKIQFLQATLNSRVYDDYPDKTQSMRNVLNRLKEENRISILESEGSFFINSEIVVAII